MFRWMVQIYIYIYIYIYLRRHIPEAGFRLVQILHVVLVRKSCQKLS